MPNPSRMTTKTTVVNIRRDDYEVYIGRAGKGLDGYFGNPFRLGSESQRQEILERYAAYFYNRLERDPEFKRRVLQLKTKVLGCFCAPRACHGDVIAKYLDSLPY